MTDLKLVVIAALVVLGALGAADANAAGPDALDVDIRAISAAQWYGETRDLLTLKLEVINNADFPVKLGLGGQSTTVATVFVFAPTTPDSALPDHDPLVVLRDEYSVRVYYDLIVQHAGMLSSVCPADQTVDPGTTSAVKLCFRVPPGETPDFVQMAARPESDLLFTNWQFVDARGVYTCEEAWGKDRSRHCAPNALLDGYPDRKPIEYFNTEPLAVEIGVKSSRLLKADGVSGVVLAMKIGVTNLGNEEVSRHGHDIMRVVALRNGEAVFYEHWVPDYGDLRETCPYTWENADVPPGLDETWRMCFRIPDTVEPKFLIMDNRGQTHVIPLSAEADCGAVFPERLCGEAAPVFGVPGAPKAKSPETATSQVVPTDRSTATVHIPVGSSVPGCEETDEGCFIPSTVTIDVGGEVMWVNDDGAAHTVTSGGLTDGGPDGVFDSGLFMPATSFSHKFEEAGEYPYFSLVHPWMEGLVIVQEAGVSDGNTRTGDIHSAYDDTHATVYIRQGALFPACAEYNTCFDAHAVMVEAGTEVVWTNSDTVLHTVTGQGGMFDDWLLPGEEFAFTFESPGTYAYGCTVHPWIRGTVVVNPDAGVGSTDLLEALEDLSLDALRDRWDMLVEGGEHVSDEMAEIVEELFARAGAAP